MNETTTSPTTAPMMSVSTSRILSSYDGRSEAFTSFHRRGRGLMVGVKADTDAAGHGAQMEGLRDMNRRDNRRTSQRPRHPEVQYLATDGHGFTRIFYGSGRHTR